MIGSQRTTREPLRDLSRLNEPAPWWTISSPTTAATTNTLYLPASQVVSTGATT